MNTLILTALTGIAATLLLDLWSILRKHWLGTNLPNYALVGRWLAGFPLGKFRHESMAAVSPVPGERLIGWIAHYLIGITFAAVLVLAFGTGWLYQPTLGPALLVGILSVVAPFLIMQPGMGAGIAASHTPNPGSARLQSLVFHTVFGFGLFAGAWLLNLVRGA